MSVRVNLLPQATRDRERAAAQRNGLIGAAGLLVAALGMTHVWATGQVDQARVELAGAEEQTGLLRGEVGELSEYRDLADRRDETELALTQALSQELSFAGLLQDFAAVMPADAQFDTVSVDVPEIPTTDELGEPVLGTLTATGQTLTSHAPGVEGLLLELEKISGFEDLSLASSTIEDPLERYATYTVEGELGSSAATGRYVDGLPEELR